jgi:iron complex transport system permease protein
MGPRDQHLVIIPLLAAALAVMAVVSVATGAVAIDLASLFGILMGSAEAAARDSVIVWSVRLPRTLLAMLVGASLAASGAVLQGLFRNPLADPGLVGVSSGAVLAAVTTIVLGQNYFGEMATGLLPVTAFVGGLLTTILLYTIATRDGRTYTATMLFGGIAIGAIAMALTGVLIFVSTEQQLREFTFWSLGSLGGATWAKTGSVSLFMLFALCLWPILARGLDRLALGEAEAGHMGVNVQILKRAAIVATALLTGAAVAVSGAIGFIGLVVPHLLRLVMSPRHRFLIPAAALLGAILLLAADMVARTIVAPAELPIGIVTACLGGPVFLWMLLTNVRQIET